MGWRILRTHSLIRQQLAQRCFSGRDLTERPLLEIFLKKLTAVNALRRAVPEHAI
jgi:hypothetical protein